MTTPFNTIKGYEVLEFDDVEMIRSSVDAPNKGTLKVNYFPDLSRFILMLNDCNYPLLHRFTIIGSDKSETKFRSYILPLEKGFYTLKLSKIPSKESIENFETILSHNSQFFREGETEPIGKTDLSPTSFSTEFSEDISGERLEGKKPKQGMISKAVHMVSRVLGGSGKNLNLTSTRTMDQLINVNQDFLTICEFPRETIEDSVNQSTMMTSLSKESGQTFGSKTTQTTVKQVNVTYPKAIVEREETLLQEIQKHKEFQNKERGAQQRHRDKEIAFLDKERALQDELNNLRSDKMRIEIKQRDEIYGQALSESNKTLQQQEQQFTKERQDFISRERNLRGDIEARIAEFKNKEKLTQEEQAEFVRREQELTELNKRLEGERVDMDKRHQALKKQSETREAQIQDKEKSIEVEKDQFKRKEEELRAATKQRLAELEKKEKMTEDERTEFKRKQKELDQMNKQIEQERGRLQSTMKEVKTQGERELRTLQGKEKQTESERQKLVDREKQLEAEARQRLDELKKKEKLTEAESKELQKRQKELEKITQRTQAAESNLYEDQQRFAQEMKKKEAKLQEKERMTENERAELKNIQQKLKKEAQLTESERKDLEVLRDKIVKEVETREAEIMRREKLTENERKELQRKEQEAEATLKTRLEELRRKEVLNQEERSEMRQREEEMTKITKMREAELSYSKRKLEDISMHARNLMVQNEKMVEGHIQVGQEVADVQRDLNKPMRTTEQTETTKFTSKSDEKMTRGRYEKTDEQSGTGMGEIPETTTSG